jgi:Holliday junction resolvasome RuvABC DNA-binding subunit
VQAAADAAKPPAPEDQLRADLLSALLNLGYQRTLAEKAIDRELKSAPDARFEDALRAVLRGLMT